MSRDLSRPLREAWIVSAVRTPVGRYGGALAAVRPDDMAATVLRAVVERAPLDPALVEDVILGCANQAGEDNRDVARMAVLLAGFPVEVGGLTVNRLCGSGLQAINSAAHAIEVGDGDVFIGGGVESMTRAPYVMAKPESAWDRGPRELQDTTLGWRFVNPKLAEHYYPYSMGETAENVAERWGVSRERQDAFALESHKRRDRGHRGRPLRRPDRPGRGAAAQGRPGGRGARRASAGGHDDRGAREAAAGVRRGRRVGHGRQRIGHQRRRVGRPARRGGTGPRARPAPDGPRRLDGRGRRRSLGHGHRADPGVTQGARAGRHRRRGPRPHRAQRGVRLAVARLHRRARASIPPRSTSTAGRSRWATRSG